VGVAQLKCLGHLLVVTSSEHPEAAS